MTSIEADQIIKQARHAQCGWGRLTASQRCETLARLRRAIAQHSEAIAETIARETSKPLLDALSGDVMVTLEMIRYYESCAAKVLRPRRLGKPALFFRGTRFESHLEPHGVALVFGPSNYPFQLAMVPLITALMAGSAVVLKVSERTPSTAALISRLCSESGIPANVVQVLHGDAEDSGALIDARPDIVFFTGSSRNGSLVAQRAAKYLIPTILELGGKDAALVFEDCNLQRTVEGITYGAFSNSGRVCVGVKRALVEESIKEEFLLRLRGRVANLNVDSGLHADLCPLSERESNLLRAQIEDALAKGATLQFPRDRSDLGRTPVLLTDVPPESRLLTEETFGPVLCLSSFRDEAEALALANRSEFALGGSIWTKDKRRARRAALTLSAGSCAVNDVIRNIANPQATFGGNRHSGYGRYHGPEGLLAFSRQKTIMISTTRRAREINWFPFTARTYKQLAGLLRFRHGGSGLISRLARMLPALWLAAASFVTAPAQSPSNTHLDINVRLTPKAHGQLAYLVFDSASGFPVNAEKAVRRDFVPILTSTDQLHIGLDLPPGVYAVSVYEDLNGNHKLDRTLLGIPREPVGVSNNPHSRMGPPRFEDCSFRIGSKPELITISVVAGI